MFRAEERLSCEAPAVAALLGTHRAASPEFEMRQARRKNTYACTATTTSNPTPSPPHSSEQAQYGPASGFSSFGRPTNFAFTQLSTPDAKLLEMRGSDGASHTLPSVFTANQEMLPRSAVVRRPFGNGTATLPLLSLAPVNVSAGAPICCLDPRRPISLVLAVTYR